MDVSVTENQMSAAVSKFLSAKRQMLIGGKWVDAASGETLPVYNPATGQIMANVPAADKEDIDRAVSAARKAFESGPWHTMSPSQRGRLLGKLADAIEAHLDELAELESLDNGKPVSVARAADVPLSADLFRYMAGWATKIEGNTKSLSMPGEFLAYTRREPVGVAGQIIPWNFPLLMASWKLGPALAAGCTIVLKVAEQTPLSALRLGELIGEVGFPEGVVNVVTGYGETAGAALAAHPDVDKVAFTGSTEVGRLIAKAAGDTNLKKVTLELGGKSPTIILPDADIEQAIAGASMGIFFNQGQTCCAGSRLYAHKHVFDKIVEGVAEHAKGIKVGPGLDPATQMGPLVSEEQLARVTGYIESGLSEGARALSGGAKKGDAGYFVEPTVLTNTKPDMKVVREEIFGPVLCAEPFDDDDLDRLAKQANDTIYGLAASIWTKDLSMAHKLAHRIKSGTVWVNCHNVFDAAMPFGGYKQSGWGREMGHEALNSYTETKAVTVKL
ncbi:MAG: aldehyde dehydrogenase family protein [Alphaproteobacteria bacterium]